MSATKALACSMIDQPRRSVISMDMGVEMGSNEVPELVCWRIASAKVFAAGIAIGIVMSMPAMSSGDCCGRGFAGMLIPGMFWACSGTARSRTAAKRRKGKGTPVVEHIGVKARVGRAGCGRMRLDQIRRMGCSSGGGLCGVRICGGGGAGIASTSAWVRLVDTERTNREVGAGSWAG